MQRKALGAPYATPVSNRAGTRVSRSLGMQADVSETQATTDSCRVGP